MARFKICWMDGKTILEGSSVEADCFLDALVKSIHEHSEDPDSLVPFAVSVNIEKVKDLKS